jgi:hypothetical protein
LFFRWRSQSLLRRLLRCSLLLFLYLLEVAVEQQLGLVRRLLGGPVADEPHGLFEARLDRFGHFVLLFFLFFFAVGDGDEKEKKVSVALA